MKKIVAILAILAIMVLSVTALAEEPVKMGVCMQGISDWQQVMRTTTEQLCAERGWECIVVNAENDAQKQIDGINSLIAQGVDCMWIHVVEPAAIASAIQDALNAGIMVNVSQTCREFVGEHDGMFYYTYDHEYAGALCAKAIAEKMGGKGKVLMLSGTTGASNTTLRSKGFRAHMAENYPEIEIINEIDVDWDRATAMSTTEDVLIANPDLGGIFCMGEDIMWGCTEALANLGMSGQIAVSNIDCSTKTVQMIMDGEVTGAATCAPGDGPICTIRLYECYSGMTDWADIGIRQLDEITFGNDLLLMTVENADFAKADYVVEGYGV